MKRFVSVITLCLNLYGGAGKKPPAEMPAPLPAPVIPAPAPPSAGSIYSQSGRFADLGRDFRARQVGDIVNIVVSEKANASASGSTNTARKSALAATLGSSALPKKTASLIANAASVTGNQQLQGQGTTTRATELTTTLSTRVIEVLANGDLVVAGSREVLINSERQTVTVKGIVRANDLSNTNRVLSERLADLELRISGKGVVQDAVRRPNILYRVLMGLLPF